MSTEPVPVSWRRPIDGMTFLKMWHVAYEAQANQKNILDTDKQITSMQAIGGDFIDAEGAIITEMENTPENRMELAVRMSLAADSNQASTVIYRLHLIHDAVFNGEVPESMIRSDMDGNAGVINAFVYAAGEATLSHAGSIPMEAVVKEATRIVAPANDQDKTLH